MKRALLLVLALMVIGISLTAYFVWGIDIQRRGQILHDISVSINIIFALTIVTVIILVIKDNNDPIVTISWLQILIFLPVVGFFLYLMFGINYRKRKMFRQKADVDLSLIDKFSGILNKFPNPKEPDFTIGQLKHSSLIKLLFHNNHSYLTINNKIETFHDGFGTNREIFSSLKKAKHHIHMEYFSISNDPTGKELQQILIERAKTGVEIRLIYDAVGCWKLGKGFINQMLEVGINAKPFLPVSLPFLSSKLNFRNHRKITIIDGKIGFIGGVNIGDKYMGVTKRFGFWRDTHLKLQGNSVYSLQKSFLIDWGFLSSENLEAKQYFPAHNIKSKIPIQLAISGPDSQWENIMQLYFSAITQAQEKVYITTPYLVLNESMTTALITAALREIDVKIILPYKADHKIVFLGTHSYYEKLLESGVKIYEYTKGFVHAKILQVDNEFVSIGSANMDIRSFKQNFEINAIIYDANYSKEIHQQFEIDLLDCKQVELEEFRKRSTWQKNGESIARLVSPLL
jgi:cardiolipin synthase